MEWFICTFVYIFKMSCSGQRVIVQEKNEDKVVEHVVTIQVWLTEIVSPDLQKYLNWALIKSIDLKFAVWKNRQFLLLIIDDEVRNFENWNCYIKSKNIMHVTYLLATFNVYIDSLNLIVNLTSLLEINKIYYIDSCFYL